MKKILLAVLLFFLFSFIGCTNPETKEDKSVKEVIELIDGLPSVDDITLDDEELVMSVTNKYNLLTEEQKQKVTNYNKLFDLEFQLTYLMDVENAIIQDIIDMIDDLPNLNRISLRNKEDIEEIEQLLEEITDFSKQCISNMSTFEKAKAKYLELVKIDSLQKEAQVIIDLINELPETKDVTLDIEQNVNNIYNCYNKISDEAKTYVTNIDILENIKSLIETMKTHNGFNPDQILSCVSNKADINTKDVLYTSNEQYNIEWSSSNNDLYNITNNIGSVSIIHQRHIIQIVTITAVVTFNNNNETITLTKEIEIAPVVYTALPTTPVATYFQTSALSSYINYSDRYKQEQTLFSEKSKEVLDIIYYAFAIPTESGDIYLSDLKVLDELVKLKENNVRIVMSISGVSSAASKIFKDLTSDSTKRAKFVSNIVKTMEMYGFDGVDIDWESSAGAYVVAENMNMLMRDLRKKLDESQAKGGSPYLLTAAIPATSWGTAADRFDFATLNKYVDYINMMTYDLNNPDKATHLSALYSSSNDKGYGFSVQYGVNLYTSKGLDKSKIIIGCAGYGKAYKITNDTSTDKYPGISSTAKLTALDGIPGSYASGTVFLNVIDVVMKTGKYKKYLEYNNSNQLVGSYLYNAEDKIFITYDSEEMMSEKYKYALSNEGMGIMCWAYTEDTADTYVNSIYDIMKSNK